MKTISINIPDQYINEVVDAMCSLGYEEQIDNPLYGQEGEPPMIPNPVTKSQFAKKTLLDFVKRTTIAWKHQQTISSSREIARSDVEAMGLN